MTQYQKTLKEYRKGNKAMAYLAFKADPTSNKDISFESFCKFFDGKKFSE